MKCAWGLVVFVGLAACAAPVPPVAPPTEGSPTVDAPPPRPDARTADSLDTTTPEQRAVATRPVQDSAERLLGETIASLGNPTKPGFWIETPLATNAGQGRVVYPDTGKSVAVELIPIDGDAGAGSRLSLPAMRLLEAALTGLPTVQVYGP